MDQNITVKIFEYLTNSKESIGKRLGSFLLAFFVIILVDASLNISSGINQTNTVDRLTKINALKKQYSKESEPYLLLENIERDIISYKHPYYYFSNYLSSFFSGESIEYNSTNTQNIPNNTLSIVFIALSSSTVLILFVFGAITSPFWSGNYSYKNIKESLAVSVILVVIVSLYTFLLSFIPVIYHTWVNYSLYFLLQISILYMTVYFWSKPTANKNQS